MDELDGQRQELKNALAAAKLKEDLGLKRNIYSTSFTGFPRWITPTSPAKKRQPHSFSALWQPLHMDAIPQQKEAGLHCKPASFYFD